MTRFPFCISSFFGLQLVHAAWSANVLLDYNFIFMMKARTENDKVDRGVTNPVYYLLFYGNKLLIFGEGGGRQFYNIQPDLILTNTVSHGLFGLDHV